MDFELWDYLTTCELIISLPWTDFFHSNLVPGEHVNVVSEEKSLLSTGGCDSVLHTVRFEYMHQSSPNPLILDFQSVTVLSILTV